MQAVAVVTAVVAALLFGISSVADQRSTKRVKTEKALSPAILLDLVKQPLWLGAIVTNLAAFALQVVALSFGSLAVVQPLLVFDLVFAVLIGRTLLFDPKMFPAGAKRWDPVLFAGVGAATLGVAGFLAIGRPTAGRADVGFSVLCRWPSGWSSLVGGCLAVAARNENLRPLALALGCGVCYGVAAFSVKLVTTEFGGGPARVFTNWPIYMLAVTGPVGFILNQDAFQQGRFLAPGPGHPHHHRPGHIHRAQRPVARLPAAEQPRGDRRRGRLTAGHDGRDRHHRPPSSSSPKGAG